MRMPLLVFVLLVASAPATGQSPTENPSAPQNPPVGCGTVDTGPTRTPCVRLTFEGEVAKDQSFVLEFGNDLLFRLNPEVAMGGWFIEVVPKAGMAKGDQDYAGIVTPPYHAGNAQYLDTSYGVSARDSVRNSPRAFNFVLDDEQYKKAAHLVDQAMHSTSEPDKKPNDPVGKVTEAAKTNLFQFPVAKGKLWVLDSRIKNPAGKDDSGSIEWIKFKVELRVPCGFPVSIGTRKLSIDSSACPAMQGATAN